MVSPAQRRVAWPLVVLAVYAVAALLLTLPLPWHAGDTVARAARADTWLNVWALAWTSDHLFSGAALLDANIFFPRGRTLAYTDHFIGQALLVAGLYRLSGNAALAYNAAWYLALVLTAWGGYLWVRRLLGSDASGEAAAFMAGTVCLLVPGKATAFGHLQVISLQGLPLALLALHRLFDRPGLGRGLTFSAAALYTALCSWYTAAYAALLLPSAAALGLWRTDPGRRRRAAVWAAAASLLVGVLMIPLALPYRAVQRELAFERPVEELIATALRPIDWLSSWSWLHTGWLPEGSGAGGHFPGFVVFALVVVGVVAPPAGRRFWPRAYLALAVAFAVLSLGPWLSVGEGSGLPLPYLALYELVPGFTALRNPYRAAFVASLLLAAPAGAGAQALVLRARGQLLARDRWRTRGPRGRRVGVVTAAVVAALATAHLVEAWPGPQEVAPLPRPGSAAHTWLDEHRARGVLELPLPSPPDLNARYQLWTIGSWVPLVNGHSGLFPPEFLRLYELEHDFPTAPFLAAVRRHFPADYILVHYGRIETGDVLRRRAEASGMEVAWASGSDVVYRLRNGGEGGWLRRRLPHHMLGERLEVDLGEGAGGDGCTVRIALRPARYGSPTPGAPAPVLEPSVAVVPAGELEAAGGRPTITARLDLPADLPELVDVDLWLVDATRTEEDESGPPVVVAAGTAVGDEGANAVVELNGTPVASAPLAMAVVDAQSGRVVAHRAGRLEAEAAAAQLLELLDGASAGDWLAVAAAGSEGDVAVERLLLLLDAAGGRRVATAPTPPVGEGRLAFIGRIGAAPGTAYEVSGPGSTVSLPASPVPCLASPIVEFRFTAER